MDDLKVKINKEVPPEEQKRIVQNFESTIDTYMEQIGQKPYLSKWEKIRLILCLIALAADIGTLILFFNDFLLLACMSFMSSISLFAASLIIKIKTL